MPSGGGIHAIISLSLQKINGVLNTAMICCPSGAITNFQLYLLVI